ncbi:hypothetical protein HDU79_002248 [Rhizoclosmatium sp. JEL0117]|nr:hypothetical protein HDU79_002248 [Rhizoclosmatium sp. JEL0117]
MQPSPVTADIPILRIASIAAIVLSSISVLLNASVLITFARHRQTLITLQPDASRIIAVILLSTLWLAILLFVINTVDVVLPNEKLLESTQISDVFGVIEYSLLITLFSADLLLAVAKYWSVVYDKRLPTKIVNIVTASAITFAIFFTGSFIPSTTVGGAHWAWMPFAVPLEWPLINAQTFLFISGISFFIICTIGMFVLYENAYFHILSVYEKSDVESVLTFESTRPATVLAFEDSDATSYTSETQEGNACPLILHRNHLLRYVAMSIGFVLFYGPPLLVVLISTFSKDLVDDDLLRSFMRWVPALNPVCTPFTVVMCFTEVRDLFFEDWGIYKKSKTESVGPTVPSIVVK